jgi:hypothetical protein
MSRRIDWPPAKTVGARCPSLPGLIAIVRMLLERQLGDEISVPDFLQAAA